MLVKVLRPFWYGGAVKGIGAEVDLPDQLAREVIYGGKASRVLPPKPLKAEPVAAPVEKQPMTTKSAAALLGKKGA
jgi:hypothetical protein